MQLDFERRRECHRRRELKKSGDRALEACCRNTIDEKEECANRLLRRDHGNGGHKQW